MERLSYLKIMFYRFSFDVACVWLFFSFVFKISTAFCFFLSFSFLENDSYIFNRSLQIAQRVWEPKDIYLRKRNGPWGVNYWPSTSFCLIYYDMGVLLCHSTWTCNWPQLLIHVLGEIKSWLLAQYASIFITRPWSHWWIFYF